MNPPDFPEPIEPPDPPQPIPPAQKFFLGCLQKRVCILPTLKGWLLILLVFSSALLWAGRSVYWFLALDQPIPTSAAQVNQAAQDPPAAQVLVVEGWAPKYALQQAAQLFAKGNYRTLFVTGGEIEEGSLLSDYKTYANLGATILLQTGFPPDRLQAVPAPRVEKDRTYASAHSLRLWMAGHGGIPASFNLISVGTHCRRSQWLFSLAFKNQARVGIIAVQNRDFSPSHWWRSSQGVRSVIDESIAYIYARVCFRSPPG